MRDGDCAEAIRMHELIDALDYIKYKGGLEVSILSILPPPVKIDYSTARLSVFRKQSEWVNADADTRIDDIRLESAGPEPAPARSERLLLRGVSALRPVGLLNAQLHGCQAVHPG